MIRVVECGHVESRCVVMLRVVALPCLESLCCHVQSLCGHVESRCVVMIRVVVWSC